MTKSSYSDLLLRFARKLGARSARAGMRSCTQSLLDTLSSGARPLDLDRAMKARGVHELAYEKDLKCDGYIEPLGDSFNSGFRIAVKQSTPWARLRFTVAHEVCHTFFYEVVPELKYEPSPADPGEEYLCNFGAAELLVPETQLKMEEYIKYPRLASLEHLSHRYEVSLEVMLFRLRALRLWSCSMLRWYRLSDGSFTLDKVYGAPHKDWRVWIVDEMNRVWNTPGSTKGGSCYVSLVDRYRSWGSELINYEMKRRGDHLMMLWSKKPLLTNPEDAPLFMCPVLSLPLFEPC